MNAQVVAVKYVTCTLLKRIAVHATESTVYVTSEKEYEKTKKGQSSLFPIGFPREDVFLYDRRDIKEPVDEKKLKRWDDGGKEVIHRAP